MSVEATSQLPFDTAQQARVFFGEFNIVQGPTFSGPKHDDAIDELLGLSVYPTELAVRRRTMLTTQPAYGNDCVWEHGGFVWSDYSTIRSAVKALELTADDTFYDLGAGYGRAVLYAALTTDAQAKGVELVAERVAASNAVKDRLDIQNARFTEGNVLDHDYSDGTTFYLFNPFSHRTFGLVIRTLRDIASTKQIRIASAHDHHLRYASWLHQTKDLRQGALTVSVFESIKPKDIERQIQEEQSRYDAVATQVDVINRKVQRRSWFGGFRHSMR